MAISLDNISSISEDIKDKTPEWLLAKQGLQLILNNKQEEGENLFKKYPESIQMFAGYSLAICLDALMTLEEDKLNLSLTTLKEVERRCSTESSFIKSVRSSLFGYSSSISYAEHLERKIILADAQVCIAILTFMQQDFTGYFKGGWVLRKAWKIYENAYHEIKNLYELVLGELPEVISVENDPLQEFSHDDDASTSEHFFRNSSLSINDSQESSHSSLKALSNGKLLPIDHDTVKRLMGAASFGYGLFQLGVSLLPPSILKFTNILGFGANRQVGLKNLMYARTGVDMRAPLATLGLLWYHTIVRPFYALDGSNLQAGFEIASSLINESYEEYSESALFLFFKGRVCRLKSDISGALESFQTSVNNSCQREIKILSMHEVGWCYLLLLNYPSAQHTFETLKSLSRWSRAFYAYLEIISAGSCNNLKTFSMLKEIMSIIENMPKGTQLEGFLIRRLKCFPHNEASFKKIKTRFWRMFVYELLYLWNTLPSCSTADIINIKNDCDASIEENMNEPMVGMSGLIKGASLAILNNEEGAIDAYQKCLNLRDSKVIEHKHISAFALYEYGYILIRNSDTKEEGRQLLLKALNYKDYDFEQRLNVRIHAILKSF